MASYNRKRLLPFQITATAMVARSEGPGKKYLTFPSAIDKARTSSCKLAVAGVKF